MKERDTKPVLVGLGEVLWDMLPTGSHMGGAPANFAYIASLLGASGAVATRVGDDQLGRDASSMLKRGEVNISCIQFDNAHTTGSTTVTVGPEGTAAYEIVSDVAWDHLQWTPQLAQLAQRADAVCFGTLAQRSPETRATIRRFLEHTSPDCVRVLDVNLRPPFWSTEVIFDSLQLANVVKLNHMELADVMRAASLPSAPDVESAQVLQQRFSLRAVCITRAAEGSILVTANSIAVHPGVTIEVVDTVGAGDAFTAALSIHLLAESDLEDVSRAANGVGAWVASQRGAMPHPDGATRAWLQREFGLRPRIPG